MAKNITTQPAPALLERWMRAYYFRAETDIGSSGVESFSMAELRRLLDITGDQIDGVVFNDSQTLGDPRLRQAIADRYANGDADRVMATQGSSEAIFLTMNALLRAGDEVITLEPCYQQLFAMAEAIGCHIKFWPLRHEHGFAADLEELKRLISRRTRMVVVNFPHNPTGSSITAAQQSELIKAVEAIGAYLVWDAAFSDLTYDGAPLPYPSLDYDRAISFGTLSKSYGLAGLRLGWCVASHDILDRFVHLRDYTILHLSPLVELLGRRAIERADVLLNLRRKQARDNLAYLTGWMKEHSDLMSWVAPKGGVSCFPKLLRIADSENLCRRLADDNRVLLVPGNCFNRPDHVRLGFGGSLATLRTGLSHLATTLSACSQLAI